MNRAGAVLEQVRLDRIIPHPENPRKDLGDLTDLAASIKSMGVLQAIVIHENPDGTYWCMLGHRRTAASRLADKTTVPAFVWNSLSVTAQIEMMVVENVMRRNLTPMEEARSFSSLERSGRSQREIAQRIGCNQSHVSRRLKLLELSESDQELVETGKLSASKALRILNPPEPKAPKAEPVHVPESLRPDPIDAMEPIGYKVIEVNAEGEYVDNWSADIHATPEVVQAEVANTTFEGEPTVLVAVALVLLPTISTQALDVDAEDSSPSDAIGSVAGGEEEGPAVPVSEQSEADAGPLVTAPEELTEERKAALVTFARTWATIAAADEGTVRESAEHEFFDSPGDAERAVKLWATARDQLQKAS
jgi:ParB/RepB/Spo0J family partition protein